MRHADSAPDFSRPEEQWPLSAAGARQAETLGEELAPRGVEMLFSSPYRRAVATFEPLAQRLRLGIEIVPDMRELKLSDAHLSDWREQLRRSWMDFRLALPGGETALACQRRVSRALSDVADSCQGKTIAVCSHGNAIALFINSIDAEFGFEQWAEMKKPHQFRFERKAGSWAWLD